MEKPLKIPRYCDILLTIAGVKVLATKYDILQNAGLFSLFSSCFQAWRFSHKKEKSPAKSSGRGAFLQKKRGSSLEVPLVFIYLWMDGAKVKGLGFGGQTGQKGA